MLYLHFVKSQNINSFSRIDSITYQMYVEKNWESIIETGEKAIQDSINFYYLQVRIGISYYELKKYEQSIKYFENANHENPTDELISEYLYYAYFFSSRFDDADKFGYNLSEELKTKLGIKKRLVSSIYIESKYEFRENNRIEKKIKDQLNQVTVKDLFYYNITSEQKLAGKLKFIESYNNIKITNIAESYNPFVLPPVYEENLIQNEYYFGINYHLYKGIDIKAAFRFIETNIFAEYSYMNINNVDTTSNYDVYINTYIAFLKFSKRFSLYNISVMSSISDMDNSTQIQPEISLTVFPLGNYNLISETSAKYNIQKGNERNTNQLILKQGIGITFFDFIFLEPSITFGRMNNFVENDAFIVNNDIDPTLLRYEVDIKFVFLKGKLNLFIGFQSNKKENMFTMNNRDFYKNYITKSIIGGIKWNF